MASIDFNRASQSTEWPSSAPRGLGWKEMKGSVDLQLKICRAVIVGEHEAKGYEEGVLKETEPGARKDQEGVRR